MGAADVGQATIIQDGLVLGVEALEGTDALLARCGPLRRAGPGGVLVKLRKPGQERRARSEEHTSELQSLMRISYAVFCLKKKKNRHTKTSVTLSRIYNDI